MVVKSPSGPPPARVALDHMQIIATWPEDMRDQWEERAAIMEHDAQLGRSVAERKAFEDIQAQMTDGPRRPLH
jgi:hypothetical protein